MMECTLFYGFVSCLDIMHAFLKSINPALTRHSYTAGAPDRGSNP